MRRPAELCNLHVNDIVDKGKYVNFRIRYSKTDQHHKGAFITIEKLEPEICPIAFTYQLIKQQNISNEDWLFTLEKKNKLTTPAVSSIVKKVAKFLNCDLKLSGHSLWISSTTAAVKASLSEPQIHSIGHWKSDTIDSYLRSISAAEAQASIKMGFHKEIPEQYPYWYFTDDSLMSSNS